MAKKKKQFDEFLGGSESLPHEVSIMQFVSSRAREISAMTSSIENPKQTKLIFQKLPVYMRRRAMSHNVKRLPRRLRQAHLAQMIKSGNGQNLPSTNKRPSRKYRRRPRNLLSEYTRRQRDKIWLETHIWHAKRFHMIDKWGYRLASHSNDKCFRANYQALRENCLLQDISYYACVEIEGKENLLITTLDTHCNTSTLTFGAKIYTNGQSQGTVMFFKKNGYPHFPIGNVDFLWKPSESNSTIKTIWIWVHPAFYNDFLDAIISSFEFRRTNVNEFERNATDITQDSNFVHENNAGCKMVIFKFSLNRFRLCGSRAFDLLREALQLPSVTDLDSDPEMDCITTEKQQNLLLNNEKLNASKTSTDDFSTQSEMDCTTTEEQQNLLNNEKLNASKTSTDDFSIQSVERMAVDENEENIQKKSWHTKYYKERENIEVFKIQKQFLHSVKCGPFDQPRDLIMGLTVLDPRFYLPEKRTKYKTLTQTCSEEYPRSTDLNRSPIWDAQIRHIASNSYIATSTINKLRSKCLVPDISNDKYFNKDIIAKIPILLIWKSKSTTGLDSSVDIIIPSKWAMPFWLAIIMRCARVGALRESSLIAFESLNLKVSHINDPDTPAYIREALITKEELTNKYFRYPPNKRVNYVKIGISSPYFCDWKNLTKGWSNVQDFYVFRNYNLLSLLQAELNPVKRKNARTKSTDKTTQFNLQDFDEYKNCLVHVQLTTMGKGVPEKFSIICMPTHEDLEEFGNNKKWEGPREKCHADTNEKSRKVSRKEHSALLRRLRRQRVEQKETFSNYEGKLLFKESVSEIDTIAHKPVVQHRTIISAYKVKMSKMCLPESTEVRHSCDREIMGYVTLGARSFLRAKGIGIGYVTLAALLEIVTKKSNIVLFRNTTTRQYRLAKLDILDI